MSDQRSITPLQSTVSLSVHDLVSQIKARGHQSTLESSEEKQLIEPLRSLLVQDRIKDVLRMAEEFGKDDIEVLVDFLDHALDHLTESKERTRALALLSKLTVKNRIFPKRLLLERVQYHPEPKAMGGSGKVHQGTDSSVCVKVMLRADSDLSATWIRELILWAHSSHLNILPFRGMFFESVGDVSQICFVSPFMKNGNLHDYAPRLVQKFRLPLIFDVINGIGYLHEWGIVHGDLKGQNVLISDEGRGMITDFGSSRVATTTTLKTASSSWTLYYVAPEVAAGGGKPTKMSDVWSFGCLCYEVMSLKPPYFQYKIDVQIVAALARNELPQRPGSAKVLHQEQNYESDDDMEQFSDDEEERIESIDDESWNLITQCCSPEPWRRLKVSEIQELLVDMMNRPLTEEEIKERMGDLTKREAALVGREGELARRESDLEKQESDIKRKEAKFEKRESEITHREREIAEKDIEIATRELRMKSKEEDLARRNTDTEQLEKVLATKDESLTSREVGIEGRDEQLRNRENQLAKHEQEVFKRERNVQKREDSVQKHEENVQKQWVEAKREAALMKEEAEAKEAEVVKREEILKGLEGAVEAMQVDVQKREQGCREKEELLKKTDEVLKRKEEELKKTEDDLGRKTTEARRVPESRIRTSGKDVPLIILDNEVGGEDLNRGGKDVGVNASRPVPLGDSFVSFDANPSPNSNPSSRISPKTLPKPPMRRSESGIRLITKKKRKNQESLLPASSAPSPPVGGPGMSVPASTYDVEAVKLVAAMGFSRTQAVEALEKCEYDVAKALNFLLQ